MYGTQNKAKRNVFSSKCLPQETRMVSNELAIHLKDLEKQGHYPKSGKN